MGQANKRRNVASYSDLPSKINGRPCDHVEFRYATPDACRRRGAPTIGDVPNIDPVQLVLHETKLLKPVLAKLNEAVDRRVISNIATDKDFPSFKQLRAEFRQMMVRATGVEELDQIKSQQLRDWGFGEECFEVLDWVDYGLLDVVKYVNEYKVIKEELLLNHWRPNNKK